MRLSRALNDKLMDVRIREKLIAAGKLGKAEVDKCLASLPDDQDNFVFIRDEKKIGFDNHHRE